MKNQSAFFIEFMRLFSSHRLEAYLKHPKCQDKLDALAAYCWNVKLSQALYPSLQTLEVALRNSLHRAISEVYKTEYWFDKTFLHPKEHDAINKAKSTLIRQKKPIEVQRIVAELHFGFWTSLFDVRYEHNQVFWPKLLVPVFPFMPKKLRTRQYLSKRLNYIRNLRNRIFHYEPIWYWHDLSEQYQMMLDLLNWLSPAACNYLKILDNFTEIYFQGFKYYRIWLEKNLKPQVTFYKLD